MRLRLRLLSPAFVLSLFTGCDSGDSSRKNENAATTTEPSESTTGTTNGPTTNAPTPSTPSDGGGPATPQNEGGGPAVTMPPTPSNVPNTGGGGMEGEPTPVAPNADPPGGGGGNGGAPAPAPSGGSGGTAANTGGGGATSGGAGTGGTPAVPSGTPVVIVGGFDYGSSSYPLRVYDVDKASGALTQRGSDVDVGPNPSYLTLSPNGDFLYVANETDDQAGGLSAVSIADDGALSLVNHQTGSDGGFTYVAVDPSGSYAFGASYNGGSVSVFPIEADGSLGVELETRDFGNGAQSHCVGFDPSGRFVFVPNKGNDEVAQLLLGSDGMLEDNSPVAVATQPGAGPRHFALHPSGSFAFVIHELGNSMTPYRLDANGALTPGTTVSTLPGDFNEQNSGAHVEVSPDGRFLYGSNRGHDSIAAFSIGEDGELTLVEHEPTRGRTPRDFEMDPAGDIVVVANQDTGTLTVFSVDADGGLTALGEPVEGPPSPAAVQMLYLPE